MDIKLLIALIGLLGICVGAFAQYHLGRKLEKNKKTIEIRFNAYLTFLDIVSELAGSARHNQNRNIEQLQKLNQAKSRVVLIGSSKVVEEMHRHFMKYGVLSSEESIGSFSRIVVAMRSDLSNEKLLSNDVISEA